MLKLIDEDSLAERWRAAENGDIIATGSPRRVCDKWALLELTGCSPALSISLLSKCQGLL